MGLDWYEFRFPWGLLFLERAFYAPDEEIDCLNEFAVAVDGLTNSIEHKPWIQEFLMGAFPR